MKTTKGGSMGSTSKGVAVASAKGKYPVKDGKPGFEAKNKIWPDEKAGPKKNAVNKGLFNKDALSGEMTTNGKYAAKASKKAKVDKSVFNCKENEIFPTANY